MNSILTTHLPEIIGLTILHTLWQVTLLWILLVAALRIWPQASSSLRYTAALATLFLCLVFAGATALYEWHALNPVQPWQDTTGFTVAPAFTAGIQQQTLWPLLLHVLTVAAPWLAWLWLAGLACMAVRFAGSFYYLRTLRRPHGLTAVDQAWQARFAQLHRAVGVKRKVILAASARITSPLTMGNLTPIVLLPAGLIGGLSTAQLEAVLVHELYHIKRRDYLVNILQALVEVLMFYHPALWHISRIIREERENCCDDLTLALCGDPVPYARALTQIHETNSFTKPSLAMSATGSTGSFAIRIKRLFNIYPNPAKARSKGIFAIGLLVTCMGLLLMNANALPVSLPTVQPALQADTVRKPIYIVDGKRSTETAANITADKIESIDVWKGEKAIEKYGPDAKDGAVAITTKSRKKKSGNEIYLIDGKRANKAETSAIDPEQIESVTVLTGKNATAKYGRKAKAGAVEVKTKPTYKVTADVIYIVDDKTVTAAEANAIAPSRIDHVNILKADQVIMPDGRKATSAVKIVTKGYVAPAAETIISDLAEPARDAKSNAPVYAMGKPANGTAIRVSGSSPLFIINNVVAGHNPLQQIDPNNIEAVTVYKPANAVERFGPNAKYGAVDIKLKPGVSYTPGNAAEAIEKTGNKNDDASEKATLEVYPNAASGKTAILFTAPENNTNVTISIVDLQGNVVQQVTKSTYNRGAHEVSVDVSGYKKGVYLVLITLNDTKLQQRLSVE